MAGAGGQKSMDELVARAELDGDELEREEFYREFDLHILNVKGGNSERYVIKESVYELALRALRMAPHEQCSADMNVRFKHWVCENFRIDSVGKRDVLFCKKRNLPIVTYEKVYAVIRGCHVVTGHLGRDKTWNEVSNNFAWVPYKAIRLYLAMCSVCKTRNPSLKRPMPAAIRSPRQHRAIASSGRKPSIPVGFMMRLQVEFLDLSEQRDGEHQYIALVRDTFSEFCWAQALATKDVARVVGLLHDIFIQFGPCRLLQSAEGDAFVRDVIARLLAMWDGLFIIVGRGQPRAGHQAALQGGGHHDFVAKLNKWIEKNGGGWSEGLPRIVHSVNTSPSTRIGVSPYEIVFDQRPHATYQGLDALTNSEPMHEEDLSVEMLQFLTQAHDGKVSKKAALKAQGIRGAGGGGAMGPSSTAVDDDSESESVGPPADDNYFLLYKGMRVAKVLKREPTADVQSDESVEDSDSNDDL